MIKITIDEKNFNLPTAWHECSLSQMIAIAPVHFLLPEARTRVYKEAVLQILLNASPKYWEQLTMQPHEWVEFSELINWIWDTTPQKLPTEFFEINNVKYYLPNAELTNVCALELAWMQVALINIGAADSNEASEKEINELIGIVARPHRSFKQLLACRENPHWNGDPRRPLSQHEVDANVPAIKLLPKGVKSLILIYVNSLVEAFADEFEMLYKQKSDAVQPNFPEGFGLEAHLRRVAKDGRFGDYHSVCQMPARTIWMNEIQMFLETEAEIANIQKQQEKSK